MLCLLPLAFFWPPGAEATAKSPPLIDRELFVGNPQIAHAQLSPSGSHIAFLKPYNNVLNIWVKKTEAPFSAAYPVTVSTIRPIRDYSWSRDGTSILYFQDQGGNENFHLFAVDPFAPSSESPRDLTPYDDVRAELLCLPKERPTIVFVGLNDRDARYHDVYQIDISTGSRTLVQQNDTEIADWVFDRSGTLRIGLHTTADGTTQIFNIGPNGMTLMWSCSSEETVQPFCFHKDGIRLYMATNKGTDVDLSRLVLLNTTTGEEEVVESDPENEVDFGAPLFSPATDDLVATLYEGDKERLYFTNEEWEQDFQRLKTKLPHSEIDLVSSSKDESLWIICARSDVDPETAYLYNRKNHQLDFLYKALPHLPSEHLSPMTPISYTARDSFTIHGYLTTPKGLKPENLPLVVMPHGGPWARDTWGYDRNAQLLSNRGYAVLQINFRGSTGYGKKFLNAGNKQWGDAMQNDITDGIEYLIHQGIVDAKRVAIFGGSYGGYATLAGLAFTPNVYAAGISYVGPSNLLTLLKSFPAYWASGKSYMDERVGNPQNPEDIDRLKRQSPLFSAQNITAPLLVVQGANDPRVKKAESDQIVIALRTLGRDVEYIVAPDEGHGFACVENKMALAVAMEKFLAKHLGGRCQDEVPSPIKEKLKAITVDINSVALETSDTENE
jgi:dipeptidyl aminopeptidase/acylaminoacyl peptidase